MVRGLYRAKLPHQKRTRMNLNLVLWIAIIGCGAAFAYSVTFSGATLAFGRALSSTNSPTGYQDAITPPWTAQFGFLVYGATLAVIALSWWTFGTLRGCSAIFVLFASALVFRRVFPGEGSLHFKGLIIKSMARRYADYVRNNDKVRAAAMKDLLDKAGVQMDYEPQSQTVG
jgi:hypothetical protein